MNVIVSNKQKNILDNANIDAIKDLNGFFQVDELINNFKDYFFSRIIIDATSIQDFANEAVLRKLVEGIKAEKIIFLLPSKPEPPKKFCELLISLGLYNFTTDINEVLQLLQKPNSLQDISNKINDYSDIYDSNNEDANPSNPISTTSETVSDNNRDNKLVIGFKNITFHAGSTTLIYMLKKAFESEYNISCEAFEIDSSDFVYFNDKKMISTNDSSIEECIRNSQSSVVLIDLNGSKSEYMCDDVIYLIEPSIIKINKLLYMHRDIFMTLMDKKIVLNKCVLNDNDIKTFSNEAGVKLYYALPFVNDRENNKVIKDFIERMGITSNQRGFLGLFK